MKRIVDLIGPTWHDQFKTSVLAKAATFSLVAADTTDVTNNNTDYHAKVTNQTTTPNAAKQATANLGISRTNAEKHARALAKPIKAHAAYTAAFGNLLGIGGPEDTCLRRERRGYGRQATDISTLKPEITGEDKKGGVVEIDFNLANSEGVNMNPESFRGYSRRNGDADFKFLACRAGVRRKRARDTSLAAPTCRAGIRWRRESDGGWPTYVDNPDTSGLVAGKPELREYIPTRRDVGGDVDLSRCSRTKAEVSQFSDEISVNCA